MNTAIVVPYDQFVARRNVSSVMASTTAGG